MESKRQSPSNLVKLARFAAAYEELVDEVLQQGFHGIGKLEMVVSNGTIQRICRTVERVDKEH